MAATVSRVKTERHTIKPITFTALTTTGITIDFEGVDENCVLIFTGSADDDTITVLKGDHIQGVKDVTFATGITANGYGVVAVPAMEFKNVSGTNRGYIVVKGKTTTSVAVVEIDQL